MSCTLTIFLIWSPICISYGLYVLLWNRSHICYYIWAFFICKYVTYHKYYIHFLYIISKTLPLIICKLIYVNPIIRKKRTLMIASESVSYTHLDVYKRQDLKNPLTAAAAELLSCAAISLLLVISFLLLSFLRQHLPFP